MATNQLAPVNTFDFAALPESKRAMVEQKTVEIRDRIGRAALNIVEIGSRLADVKAALKHGEFGDWLQAEFAMSEQTARRMMSVASQFKTLNLSDMSIAPSALYLLASPSTPEPVRAAVVARAKAGEKITHAVAKEAVQVAVKRKEPAPAPITPNPEAIPDDEWSDEDDGFIAPPPGAPKPTHTIVNVEVKPEPPKPVDPIAAYNATIEAALAHLEADAKEIAKAAGAESSGQNQRKLTNPAIAKHVTWSGTVGLLREAAAGLKGNLVVPHPSKPGEYVSATAAHRIKAINAK